MVPLHIYATCEAEAAAVRTNRREAVFCCLRELTWLAWCGKTTAGGRAGAYPLAAAGSRVSLNQAVCLI